MRNGEVWITGNINETSWRYESFWSRVDNPLDLAWRATRALNTLTPVADVATACHKTASNHSRDSIEIGPNRVLIGLRQWRRRADITVTTPSSASRGRKTRIQANGGLKY